MRHTGPRWRKACYLEAAGGHKAGVCGAESPGQGFPAEEALELGNL